MESENLCYKCRNLDIRKLCNRALRRFNSDEGPIVSKYLDGSRVEIWASMHLANLRDLKRRKLDNCKFCYILTMAWEFSNLESQYFQDPPKADSAMPAHLKKERNLYSSIEAIIRKRYKAHERICLGVCFSPKGIKKPAYFVLWYQSKKLHWCSDRVAFLGFKIPCQELRVTPELCCLTEIARDNGLAVAREWLQSCKDHPRCDHHSIPFLPSKVIDVGSATQTPSIHTSSDKERAEYTALNTDILAQKLEPHFYLTNSQTIHDAIAITRYIGLKYLWVDSLCRPGTWDWWGERKGEVLGEIFQQATLTIEAKADGSADAGIFNKLTHPKSLLSCRIPWKSEETSTSEIRLSLILHPTMDTRNSDDHCPHFMTNPEALQARLISSRVLSYSKGDIKWTCPQLEETERGERNETNHLEHTLHPLDLSFLAITNSELVRTVMGLLTSNTTIATSTSPDFFGPFISTNLWYRVVSLYTQTVLPKNEQTEKLARIEMLARAFDRRLDDFYRAGLWETTLIAGLLWQYSSGVEEQTLSCPSWSWASLRVERGDSLDWPMYMTENPRIYYSWTPEAKLLKVWPSNPSQFGRVEFGESKLIIEARCRIIPWAQFCRPISEVKPSCSLLSFIKERIWEAPSGDETFCRMMNGYDLVVVNMATSDGNTRQMTKMMICLVLQVLDKPLLDPKFYTIQGRRLTLVKIRYPLASEPITRRSSWEQTAFEEMRFCDKQRILLL